MSGAIPLFLLAYMTSWRGQRKLYFFKVCGNRGKIFLTKTLMFTDLKL
jgi:hypothetical protein